MKNITPAVLLFCLLILNHPLYSSGDRESEHTNDEYTGSTYTGSTYTVTDSLHRTVSFNEVPRRIVLAGRAVLFSANILYMFPEIRDRIVGLGPTDQGMGDFYPFIDNQAEQKIRYPNNAGPEQLAAAKPDLVILKHFMRESLGEPLERIGIPVLYLNLESPQAYYDDIKMLGILLKEKSRSDAINSYYQEKVQFVRKEVQNQIKPSVLVLSYSLRDGETAFSIPPAHWIQAEMIEIAGGEPIWRADNPGGGWKKVNLEQIARWDPDFIFVISYKRPANKVVEELKNSGSWRALLQPDTRRIAAFPADFYSWDQPDARWILGLLWAAKILHPRQFAGLDLAQETKRFYTTLYFTDESVIEEEILPRLRGFFAE